MNEAVAERWLSSGLPVTKFRENKKIAKLILTADTYSNYIYLITLLCTRRLELLSNSMKEKIFVSTEIFFKDNIH